MIVWRDSFKKHSGLSSFLVKCVRFVYLDNASVQMQELDDRVVNMYKSVRPILQRYRSGKLPKAFKIIPNLRNWEQVGNLSYLNWKKLCEPEYENIICMLSIFLIKIRNQTKLQYFYCYVSNKVSHPLNEVRAIRKEVAFVYIKKSVLSNV